MDHPSLEEFKGQVGWGFEQTLQLIYNQGTLFPECWFLATVHLQCFPRYDSGSGYWGELL